MSVGQKALDIVKTALDMTVEQAAREYRQAQAGTLVDSRSMLEGMWLLRRRRKHFGRS